MKAIAQLPRELCGYPGDEVSTLEWWKMRTIVTKTKIVLYYIALALSFFGFALDMILPTG